MRMFFLANLELKLLSPVKGRDSSWLATAQGKLVDSFSVAFGANATNFTPTPNQADITDKVLKSRPFTGYLLPS